jgi:hypothetical protein
VRDTSDSHISELLPPFLRYSENNGYSYINSANQNQTLTSEQQNDLRSVIETERNNLRERRSELRNRNSNFSGGKKSKKRRTRRRKHKRTRKHRKYRRCK